MIPAGAVLTEVTQTTEKKYRMPLPMHPPLQKSSSLRNVFSSANLPLKAPNLHNVQPIRHDLAVSNETQTIIESCDLNGPFATGGICAFPLTTHQYAGLQTEVGKKLTLFNYTSRVRWEVELLELYSPEKWSILMSYKSMDHFTVLEDYITRGCKIRFTKRIL